MISVNNIGSADRAVHYFSADNYYTQDDGLEMSEWFGKGAVNLVLKGKIDEQDFSACMEGKIGTQELGRFALNQATNEAQREHRTGTDITFSAPKSVSLLAEVAENRLVLEALEHAVKVALQYTKENLAQTRQMVNGKVECVTTKNIVAALFRHNTCRDLDPQTHTHAVFINATQRDDGQWRSMFNDDIFKSQRIIGAIYTSELASSLQKLRFELTRNDSKGNFEISGIDRVQIEQFSQCRAEIKTALEELGMDINTASAHAKDMAALITREKKTDVAHDALLDKWKYRAGAAWIDFVAIQSRAELIKESGGVKRLDKLSGRQAIEFATAHLIEREVVVSKRDLLKTSLAHSMGRVAPRAVIHAFDTLVKEGDLVHVTDDHYTTAKMLNSERWALEQIVGQKNQSAQIMSPDAVSEKLAHAEAEYGIRFTDGQANAISKVLTTEDRFVAI